MPNTLDDIKEYAKAVGINSLCKYTNKEDLIRTIQLEEGHTDCFNRIMDCSLNHCKWFDDCGE